MGPIIPIDGTAFFRFSSDGYPRRPGRWDEMTTTGGNLRPVWTELIETLAAVPAEEIERRWRRGQRIIADHGITFHVRGSGGPADRPLRLDPIPLVMGGAEWRNIADGLAQRARLLEAILADLYGERRLIAEGALPAALILGHPRFLRSCCGSAPPKARFLHVFAADLARLEDGRWTVLSERTEAPSGIGFAVENRLIVSRILAESLWSSGVRRLDPFVEGLRECLLALSSRRFETPRLVLLTPGPDAETYFEHAYLSRLLGCTLVESEDLTVRDDRVFLKTLDGLQPVDVIFRQTAGSLCDPLELDSRSELGIAGLTGAVRAGTVAVANALGSGVLETPALAAYLPALCRRLLGEELVLPSVPAYWCGDPAVRAFVLERLDRLAISSTYDLRVQPVFGESLSQSELRELAAKIEMRPNAFTARELVAPSTAPVWVEEGRLKPRPLVLRAFAAASNGGFSVMPGGFARTSDARELPMLALHDAEGGSKDTWILSDRQALDECVSPDSAGPLRLSRGGSDLPSRVADNMFWFGRYLERCEDIARTLRAVYLHAEDSIAGGGGQAALTGLTAWMGAIDGLSATAADAAIALGRQQFDPAHPTGLAANVERLQIVAGRVRDRLSLDAWRNVQCLRADLSRLISGSASDFGEVQAGLTAVVMTLGTSSGLVMENMTRGLGWRFLDIGRRLERAAHIVDLLSGAIGMRGHDLTTALDLLLTVLDSGMTYRSRYDPTPHLTPVLDLLLCDDANPRSVAYQSARLAEHVDHLSSIREPARTRPEQRLMIHIDAALRTTDVDALADPGALGALLDLLRARLWELSEILTREYFAHAGHRTIPSGAKGR